MMTPELRAKLLRRAERLERRLGLRYNATTGEYTPIPASERQADALRGGNRGGRPQRTTEDQLRAAGMLPDEPDDDDDD